MNIAKVFAAMCVSDMERSVVWYTRLVGRPPDDRPMEGLAQWHFGDGAGVQLVRDPGKAGSSLITIVTPVMEHARRRLAADSLQLEADIQGDFGVIAQISDPDGNRITLAEPS